MESLDFLNLIGRYNFSIAGTSDFGERVFETKPKSDNWSDGYTNKYIITFRSTMGVNFSIDKNSVGGFMGDQNITERLFSGTIENEDDFTRLLKQIGFGNIL